MRGRAQVAEQVRKAEYVLMSTIVVGELLFGFRNDSRFQQNFELLEAFLANRYVKLIPLTFVTADRFGRIAASLRAKGCLIPTNDIWIAAHTFETGADPLSFDEHFAKVDGLTWIPLGVSQ
jgi:tRNA(fMet)-specific endonuclease VapC